VSSRSLLVASALLALLALPLCACGSGEDAPADPQGARVERVTIDSAAVGRKQPVTVVVPPGEAPRRPRPLLVFLHGRGQDDRSHLDAPMFAALRRLGPRAPIVAFPDGGGSSYWHDRDDGAWGRYVTGEVIPQIARRFGADRRRVAIGGISMGGFGALDLAAHAAPGRFCAVGAHSPALWQTGGETADGAFDDAEDFAAHDVIAVARERPTAFAAQPLWLDAGNEDPFLPGDEAFAAALRAGGVDVRLATPPGGHEDAYWEGRWKDYLPFYADALARCGAPGATSDGR
jgi:S-formylglutathione hydrolase FrmB